MGVKPVFFEKFRKVIALVDSDREGERHAAADRAWQMCEENSLSVREALEGSFGGTLNDPEKEQLRHDNQIMAEELERLAKGEGREGERSGGLKEFFKQVWFFPQVRMLLVLWWVGLCFWAATGDPRVVPVRLSFLCGILAASAAIAWLGREFERNGTGTAVLKIVAFLGGVYFSVCAFKESLWIPDWSGSERNLLGAEAVVVATAFFTISNMAKWLAILFAHSNRQPFRELRELFG